MYVVICNGAKLLPGFFGHRCICFCHEGFGLGESTVKVSSTDTSGPTRSPHGHIWAHSRHILGHLGPILGPMFGPFGSIWSNFRWALGLLWAYYGPILHPWWAHPWVHPWAYPWAHPRAHDGPMLWPLMGPIGAHMAPYGPNNGGGTNLGRDTRLILDGRATHWDRNMWSLWRLYWNNNLCFVWCSRDRNAWRVVLSFQMPSITSYMVFESFHRSHISYHNIGVHVLVYLVLPQVDVLDTPFDAYACLLASFFITRHVHVLRGVIFHNQPNTQNISCRIILAMNSDCIAHEPYTFHFCLVCASSYIHLL